MKKILKYSIVPIIVIAVIITFVIITTNKRNTEEAVDTELVELQKIEDKLKRGQNVSEPEILDWGTSDLASKEEIKEYIENNGMVALIFIETMRHNNYDKAAVLYEQIDKNSLSIEDLKGYNWDNYEIVNNIEIIENFNCITISLDDKKIWIYVAGSEIVDIKESTI